MNQELKLYVIDIETNGLKPSLIHCVSCCYLDSKNEWQLKSTTNYDEMRKLFLTEFALFIGHNIIRFDIPTVQRLLNITIPKSSKCADSLSLSWYIAHDRKEHNLDSWGITIGIPKVEIKDDEWEGLPIEKYIERCEVDTRITTNVWVRCFQKLLELYGTSEKAYRLIDYLSNKMYAAHLAEASRWKLDVTLCKKNLLFLEQELNSSISSLTVSMPPVLKKNSAKVLKRPNSLYLKSSNKMSKIGESWLNTLKEFNLPLDHEGDIEINGTYQPANPQSSQQRKDWLLSMNWIPQTYKTVTDKDGTKRDIPQIMKNGEPCESVVALAVDFPEVNALLNVGVLVHRTAMLRRWLKDASEDGYLVASIAGFTSTLRFIHSGILNIPKPKIRYGEYLRSCLIAENPEHELVGSDLKSLETYTKLSMVWPHDHRYVKDELSEDFDGNLSLALHSGAITEDESKFYKWYKGQK